jgi:uncharacterized protein (DUF2249 family)
MAEALDARQNPKRTAWVDYYRWRENLAPKPRTFDDLKNDPTPDHPLVYHLFGRLEEPDSLVVTEDDYMDYLMYVIKSDRATVSKGEAKVERSPAIPSVVNTPLTTHAVLLLGFELNDWSFRTLFRLMLRDEGGQSRLKAGPTSVAVQLNPDEISMLNPQRARKYLEQVFGTRQISIFWGRAEDFLQQLVRELEKTPGALYP